MAVGGVAYRLGLMGPTMPVLLNCAASLVAVHHAVAELRRGEVDLALVGGVNAILSSGLTREMAALGMLSPEGRCSTFDAAANGFVRSEGCGMVVLKRLREAEGDGDRIWGVVNGSAVNQNGATAGPTVPNGRAQQQVIEEALARAGVSPASVDYLEAHGGASELGDPIELQAAGTVYGRGRETDSPLLVGSVKTNIGHLESAAGIAALIKAVLAMHHGVIPRHLHFRDPNPHVDWDGLPVRVTSANTPWPQHPERPPRAGVSAFGISGTNAHVVVEGVQGPGEITHATNGTRPPPGPPRTVAVRAPDPLADLQPAAGDFCPRTSCVLPLSGKSDEALRELAGRYLAWLDERAADLAAGGRGRRFAAPGHGLDRGHGTRPLPAPGRSRVPGCRLAARRAERGRQPGRPDASSHRGRHRGWPSPIQVTAENGRPRQRRRRTCTRPNPSRGRCSIAATRCGRRSGAPPRCST